MITEVVKGLLIPFAGTVLGSLCVFFMRSELNRTLMSALDAAAAGVMCAASYFSLLAPAIEKSERLGRFCFIPCCIGFAAGIILFITADFIMYKCFSQYKNNKLQMLVWAVTLHNIPEGMAVGVVYAAILSGDNALSLTSALTLSAGIAVQNFPEGAIISMPLKANGKSKIKAFAAGTYSAVAELAAGIATLALSSIVAVILPYALSFAAGAMFYVVMAELVPEFTAQKKKGFALSVFAFGFVVMMALDAAFG